MHPATTCLVLCFLTYSACKPYGGWGPGEGFGHTGRSMPPKNPNAVYGYDYHDIFDTWTTYGSRHNPHKNRTKLYYGRFKKHNKESKSDPIIEFGDRSFKKTYRREKAFEDFYKRLDELFGRFKTPSIGVH